MWVDDDGERYFTYFRHQSADYVPSGGFVAVAVAEGAAPDLSGSAAG